MMGDFISNGLHIVILKGDDYAESESVAMTEAFFASADLGLTVPQILYVHVRKHMAALANYMHRGSLRSEDIRSRLNDIAVYMALIDSYVADPDTWLHHLDRMVHLDAFGTRAPEEVARLSAWIQSQRDGL